MNRPYELHHGDALEFMRSLGAGSIDHVITDPPYSEHVHANHRSRQRDPQERETSAVGRARSLGFEHITHDTMLDSAEQFARLAQRWVLVFTTVESSHMWRHALVTAGLDYVRAGIWIKPNSAPQFTGDRPAAGYECIVIAHQPGAKRWNGGGKRGIWTHCVPRTDRTHPTEKPVDLMSELVADFTDSGELILDPFAGSGTTGVAALKHGRRFIGSELDESHYVTARKRLAAAYAQPRILEATT